jgi:hypothetical protein
VSKVTTTSLCANLPTSLVGYYDLSVSQNFSKSASGLKWENHTIDLYLILHDNVIHHRADCSVELATHPFSIYFIAYIWAKSALVLLCYLPAANLFRICPILLHLSGRSALLQACCCDLNRIGLGKANWILIRRQLFIVNGWVFSQNLTSCRDKWWCLFNATRLIRRYPLVILPFLCEVVDGVWRDLPIHQG